MFKIAVLVSGSGTNMKKLMENDINIDLVISDRKCSAIDYANDKNIKTFNVGRKDTNKNLKEILKNEKIDLVVLAGFLSILKEEVVDNYKVINIHPSLLPKYGGMGMYGIKVHEAVFKNKEKVSGCTVHYVTCEVDKGSIIGRAEVNIEDCENAEQIQKKVLKEEWKLLPKVVKQIIKENIKK